MVPRVGAPVRSGPQAARDRIRGPNTGGMGTYGPVALPDPDWHSTSKPRFSIRSSRGWSCRHALQGTLFANLMLVPNGQPALIEINVRFGDPETQILANLLEGDLCELLIRAARASWVHFGAHLEPRQKRGMCGLGCSGLPASPRGWGAHSGSPKRQCRESASTMPARSGFWSNGYRWRAGAWGHWSRR